MERMSFAKQHSPMLIGVVREHSARTAIAAIRNCSYHGATGIDLHLSCLREEDRSLDVLRGIVQSSRLPILALHYNIEYDGTAMTHSDEQRLELFMRALDAGCSAIDIQGYTLDLPSKTAFREEFSNLPYSFIKARPKEVVVDPKVIDRQMELIDRVHGMGAEVLLSTHPGVPMTCEQVVDLALFLEKRNPDVIKIVTTCSNEDEMAEGIRTMLALKKEVKTPVSYHCSGASGILTRILNPILGGYLIFCSDGYSISSTLEQIDLSTAKAIIDNIQKIY